MEWYRDDLDERSRDPFPKLKKELLDNDFSEDDLKKLKKEANNQVKIDYEKALAKILIQKIYIHISLSYSYYRRKRRKKTK